MTVKEAWIKGTAIILFGLFVWKSISYLELGRHLKSYALPWLLFIVGLLVYRYRNWVNDFNRDKLFGLIVLTMISSGLISFAIPRYYQYPGGPRYVGVYESFESDADDEGNVSSYDDKHELYNYTDDWKSAMEAKSDDEDFGSVGSKWFLFWQTGYDKGFRWNTTNLPESSSNLLDKIEPLLTIGTIAVFEIILLTLYDYLIICLLWLAFFQIRKQRRMLNKSDKWRPFFVNENTVLIKR
jgi:hypothetical protein